MLQDPSLFASNIDAMMKQTLGIPGDAEIEEEEEIETPLEADNAEDAEQDDAEDEETSTKDEL